MHIKYKVTPHAQKSVSLPLYYYPLHDSGEKNIADPAFELVRSVPSVGSIQLTPKSASFTSSFSSINMFSGLISRCKILTT